MPLDDYAPLVGPDTIARMRGKAAQFAGTRIAHVNGTYMGGGVAEMLATFIPLFHELGLRPEWRILRGTPEFFHVTKMIHNALQGGVPPLTDADFELYQAVVAENATWTHLDHDLVVIHDPQPLPLIAHYDRSAPWFWRCHIDMSEPNARCWDALRPFVEQYDAAIVSLLDYRHASGLPHAAILPAIDPFSPKNCEMDDAEAAGRLKEAGVPADLPLVTQVSRFDPWKDPQGVIDAARIAREQVDFRLVLLGNFAADDPEGQRIYEQICDQQDDRTMILTIDDPLLVNALQRASAIVVQKSIREGFGLTVTEALWKGTPVIGGNVGGIPHQIVDGENGYLVSSVEECAQRIVTLLQDDAGRDAMGARGREVVSERFLMTRLVEQYLDLFAAHTGGA